MASASKASSRFYEALRGKAGYEEREALLKELYRKFGSQADYEDIYRAMQGIDFKARLHFDESRFYELEKVSQDAPERWKEIFVGDKDGNWFWVEGEFAEEEPLGNLGLVKVYASVADFAKTADIFYDAVHIIIQESDHRFHAKMGKYKRKDNMCFWVSRKTFFELEKYFFSISGELVCNIPFVPYRGKLGVSREFSTFGSLSSETAEMIADYFRTVKCENEIDFGDMYSLMVGAWNKELPEVEKKIEESFEYFNAQTILILLDTADVLTDRTEISDDHIFLTEDSRMWRALGSSHSWDVVEENYRRGY